MTDYDITEAMLTYGGSFIALLGRLYRQADEVNQRRLRQAFPEYWDEYTELARRHAQVYPEPR